MVDTQRLFAELRSATPNECVDVILIAASIAAQKRVSTPREILDGAWKSIPDERYLEGLLPALDLVTSPL